MLRKKISIFAVLIAIGFFAFAQDDFYRSDRDEEEPSFKDRIHLGGGAGVQFGNRTVIEISPKLAIEITDKLYVGLGVSYSYYKINLDRIYGSGGLYQTSIYGGSVFANYLLLKNVFAHAEYEALNFEQYDNLAQEFNRRWIGSFLVGGGYRQYFNNEKSYLQVMLLYNLNFQPNSPYSSPLVPRVQIYF
ncbi:MAG: hypothetical protein HOD63_05805 [Bacteroidetes bacterium]|jgi:hypothetical protein|nr:hypothetical protein [Bacteroidota bacterium]MBT5530069.1 hypothetical protein [Cytophagia bacterium]MBT3423145.1 hypothetical protein [Bacteroidota bacterium]MBT3800418.1 hypothetical protein [Bacteroidota bacterium]MBT3933328.1 hypothetical protein [Bacteroidota bacterium]